MDKYTVKRFILASTIMVEVEGMKAMNNSRRDAGMRIAFGRDEFQRKANVLLSLAVMKDEQL
jgi:hypothetical protein